MSAQTGSHSLPPPPSSRGFTRVKEQVGYWQEARNPVWIREMRQGARLTRTPFLLMSVTVLLTLLVCAVGALSSIASSPAKTGFALFQIFFSVAFFVVAFAGPAVAANSIASEREGRTWEALMLTGLSPGVIARGKFMGAYTAICTYIVTLAPVASVAFLFGGVTTFEMLTAFIWLFLIAALSVTAGLAISSKMGSMRGALLLTVLVAVSVSSFAYLTAGVGLGAAMHELWRTMPVAAPIWLPLAYTRAPLGLEYIAYLWILPIALVTVPAWFFYEVTVANLKGYTDDRSTRIRIWFIVTSIFSVCGIALAPLGTTGVAAAGVGYASQSLLLFLVAFFLFVAAGEPLAPHRRVRHRWKTAGAGGVKRALGPGIMRAAVITFATLYCGVLASYAVGLVHAATSSLPKHIEKILWMSTVSAAYAGGFGTFLIGFTTYVRARSKTIMAVRVVLLVGIVGAFIVPWLVAAIGAMFAHGTSYRSETLALACLSPAFVFAVLDKLDRSVPPGSKAVLFGTASLGASVVWGVVGLELLRRSRNLIRKTITDYERAIRAHEATLAKEDAARAEGKHLAEGEAAAQPAAIGSIHAGIAGS